MRINDNFELLPESYLFSTVAARLREFREANPGVDVIRMDIGDVTLPIPAAAIEAMHRAVDDMADRSSFHGYGPEQGYAFLREAVAANDYAARGVAPRATSAISATYIRATASWRWPTRAIRSTSTRT